VLGNFNNSFTVIFVEKPWKAGIKSITSPLIRCCATLQLYGNCTGDAKLLIKRLAGTVANYCNDV